MQSVDYWPSYFKVKNHYNESFITSIRWFFIIIQWFFYSILSNHYSFVTGNFFSGKFHVGSGILLINTHNVFYLLYLIMIWDSLYLANCNKYAWVSISKKDMFSKMIKWICMYRTLDSCPVGILRHSELTLTTCISYHIRNLWSRFN